MPEKGKIIGFYALVLLGIPVIYFAPPYVTSAYCVLALIGYLMSKDEAFWLAFFMVLSDGFFSFFGPYQVVVSLVPGLPGIEVGQLYVLLSVFKAMGKVKRPEYKPFYNKVLQIMFIYLIFLIVQGYALGLSPKLNIQFRIIKWLIPLLLFFSIPRLFRTVEQYRDIFVYLFPVAFATLGAQVFSIMFGISPSQYVGVGRIMLRLSFTVSEEDTYRGFYNDSISLINFLGAFFFLAYRPRFFSSAYLFAVILATFSAVFLSATRGWTISFFFILACSMLLVVESRSLVRGVVVAMIFVLAAEAIPLIRLQIHNAFDRILTVEALASGDLTADGTLVRLTERGPRVLKRWRESPLTGLGFSDLFIKSQDGHVGNHNILLHSGIIGAALMASFFAIFCLKLFNRSVHLSRHHPARKGLLVFIIFLIGWFLLHSTSEQFFSYYQEAPGIGILYAVFFSFAALIYRHTLKDGNQAEHRVNLN